MEIREVSYSEVVDNFSQIKPDLLDEWATYFGAFVDDTLVGIVSYVEHQSVIYLCHAFVKEEYRQSGIYKLLWSYRDSIIKDSEKVVYAHCNVDSLKHFINNGYHIEKALFKVVRN
jgi:hypothetical protein